MEKILIIYIKLIAIVALATIAPIYIVVRGIEWLKAN